MGNLHLLEHHIKNERRKYCVKKIATSNEETKQIFPGSPFHYTFSKTDQMYINYDNMKTPKENKKSKHELQAYH